MLFGFCLQRYLGANANPRVDLAVLERSKKKTVVRQCCTHLNGICYIIDGRVVKAFKHLFNLKFKYGFKLEFSVFKEFLALISVSRQMGASRQLMPCILQQNPLDAEDGDLPVMGCSPTGNLGVSCYPLHWFCRDPPSGFQQAVFLSLPSSS